MMRVTAKREANERKHEDEMWTRAILANEQLVLETKLANEQLVLETKLARAAAHADARILVTLATLALVAALILVEFAASGTARVWLWVCSALAVFEAVAGGAALGPALSDYRHATRNLDEYEARDPARTNPVARRSWSLSLTLTHHRGLGGVDGTTPKA
jgi:hypothetical protein